MTRKPTWTRICKGKWEQTPLLNGFTAIAETSSVGTKTRQHRWTLTIYDQTFTPQAYIPLTPWTPRKALVFPGIERKADIETAKWLEKHKERTP